MKKIFIDIIQFRGTHYNFGLEQGKILKNSFIIKNREQQWKVRQPLFSINVKETEHIFQKFAPYLWEELIGLGDALKWPIERVLLEFGGYRLTIPSSGCSIYAREHFFIRNYDYHPKTYDGRYVLYEPKDEGFATIGISQRVTGRCDGMNEKGLVMAYNFVNRRRPGNGFVCNMIGRMILENCSSIDEAVQFLKEVPHRGAFNYVLFDGGSHKPSIVEASPRGVKVRSGFVCTNHFEIYSEENRHVLDDSKKRSKIIKRNHKNRLDEHQFLDLFKDPEKGIFSELYKSWAGTIHTAVYFPKSFTAWLSLGGNREPTKINFSNWLQGRKIPLKKIVGHVNTSIPFLHMEKATWHRS